MIVKYQRQKQKNTKYKNWSKVQYLSVLRHGDCITFLQF